MFLMSWCKFAERRDLCADLFLSKTGHNPVVDELLQFVSHPCGNRTLFLVATKDPTSVLKATVVSLTQRSCWVVELEKETNKFFKVFFGFIQFNIQNFDVCINARADLLVGGILETNAFIG